MPVDSEIREGTGMQQIPYATWRLTLDDSYSLYYPMISDVIVFMPTGAGSCLST